MIKLALGLNLWDGKVEHPGDTPMHGSLSIVMIRGRWSSASSIECTLGCVRECEGMCVVIARRRTHEARKMRSNRETERERENARARGRETGL